jgi:hypothetical protein
MENDHQPNRCESGPREKPSGDIAGSIFDEQCFTAGTDEHGIASTACLGAKTYLSDGEIDAAFALIDHQIKIARCVEQVAHLIQHAREK